MAEPPSDEILYHPHQHLLAFPMLLPHPNIYHQLQMLPQYCNPFNPFEFARFKLSEIFGCVLPDPEEPQNIDPAAPATPSTPAAQEIDNWDGPSTSTGRRQPFLFSVAQNDELERCFRLSKYLTPDLLIQLSNNLGLTENQVKMWFNNRRRPQNMRADLTQITSYNGMLPYDPNDSNHQNRSREEHINTSTNSRGNSSVDMQSRCTESFSSFYSDNNEAIPPSPLHEPATSQNENFYMATAQPQQQLVHTPFPQQPQQGQQMRHQPFFRRQNRSRREHINTSINSRGNSSNVAQLDTSVDMQSRGSESFSSFYSANNEAIPPSPSLQPTSSQNENFYMATAQHQQQLVHIPFPQQPQQGQQMVHQPFFRHQNRSRREHINTSINSRGNSSNVAQLDTSVDMQSRGSESFSSFYSDNNEAIPPSPSFQPASSQNENFYMATAQHQQQLVHIPFPQQPQQGQQMVHQPFFRHQNRSRREHINTSTNSRGNSSNVAQLDTSVGMQSRGSESFSSFCSDNNEAIPPSPSLEPASSQNENFYMATAEHQQQLVHIPIPHQPQQGQQMQDQPFFSQPEYALDYNHDDNWRFTGYVPLMGYLYTMVLNRMNLI